jgi:hypothetical protein
MWQQDDKTGDDMPNAVAFQRNYGQGVRIVISVRNGEIIEISKVKKTMSSMIVDEHLRQRASPRCLSIDLTQKPAVSIFSADLLSL